MRTCMFIACIALVVSSATAEQVFTERVSFELAVGPHSVEGFESYPVVGTGADGATASQSFGGFSVASTPNAVKLLDTLHSGADNTTPGGTKYLYLDTDIGGQGSVTTFTFNEPIVAIGFDYTQLNESGNTFLLTIGGNQYTIPPNPTPYDEVHPLFWGIIADAATFTIEIDSDSDSGYGIDEVTTAIPEPATLTLLAASGWALLRRRRGCDG